MANKEEDEIIQGARKLIKGVGWEAATTSIISEHIGRLTKMAKRPGMREVEGMEEVMLSGAVLMAVFAENPAMGIDLENPPQMEGNA